MCGIAGYINKNELKPEQILRQMLEKIAHRGPDASQVFMDDHHKVAFGHNRLSIIDTSQSANQPMVIDEQVIVFNGEIYNFLELKDSHLQNVNFTTNSDTEVLLRLYQKYGIKKTLKLIRGMFAFALLDKSKNKVYLVRDHVGKKPLYYFSDHEGIFFASEIKAFEPLQKNIFALNEDVFFNAMYYRSSKQLSPYINIDMLASGHYIELDLINFQPTKHQYFTFNDLVDEKIYKQNNQLSKNLITQKFDKLLTQSIKRRLIADVEVASMNSGGVDSSLISAIAYKLGKLKMLHVDVEEYSELKYANLLANHLNEELLVLKTTRKDLEENIDATIKAYEFPLVHPNSYGISEVSRLAREQNITVLLGGEGADELFAGYGYQRKFFISQKLSWLFPEFMKKLLKRFSFLMADQTTQKTYQATFHCTEKYEMKRRYNKAQKDYAFIKNKTERNTQAFLLNDLKEYLQPLLLRADKMGMMQSIEMRSPFLDLDIIEFALNLPIKYKLSMSKGKIIVKNVAKKYLPSTIINRKKVGFAFPFVEKCRMDINETNERNYILYSKNKLKR